MDTLGHSLLSIIQGMFFIGKFCCSTSPLTFFYVLKESQKEELFVSESLH